MLVFVWYALLYVHSSFAIILMMKRKMVAFLLMSFRCLVTVNVLWFFLTVPLVGLQCMIVVFPDHAHLLSKFCHCNYKSVYHNRLQIQLMLKKGNDVDVYKSSACICKPAVPSLRNKNI